MGAGQVGVEAVADHQGAARAESVEGSPEETGLRFADDLGGRVPGDLDGGEDRACPRPVAPRHRIAGIPVGSEQDRPPPEGEHRLAELGVVEPVVAGDDDDLRPADEGAPVDDPQAGVGDVAVDRRRADHDGALAGVALGEHVLERPADGDHLLERSLDPD